MKEYETREDLKKYAICECGHGDFEHELKGLILIHDGQCKKCQCPQFKKEQELTMKELAKLCLYRRGYTMERLKDL